METESKPQTTIIPAMDTEGLEVALAGLQREGLVLPELKSQAEAMKVETAQQYAEAGAMLVQVRSLRKAGTFRLGPFEEIVKRVAAFLKAERMKHEGQVDAIDATITEKMAEFKRKEREAAQKEAEHENERRRQEAQRKANEDRKAQEKEIEKRRKAGDLSKREAEQQKKEAAQEATEKAADVREVTVEPNVPKVTGLRGRVNWYFEVVDESKLPRRFLKGDLVAIGVEVRHIKDKAKAEAAIPGIRVWSEDSI